MFAFILTMESLQQSLWLQLHSGMYEGVNEPLRPPATVPGQDVPDGVKSLPSLHLHAPPAPPPAPPPSLPLFPLCSLIGFYCGLNGSVVSAVQPGWDGWIKVENR